MSITPDLDIDELRLNSDSLLDAKIVETKKTKSKGWIYQPVAGDKFLRGPIPWLWLLLAGQAKGKAIHVAIALWYQAGLHRSATFSFNQSRLTGMGVSRDSARRGLKELERLKLVLVVRHPGRKPIVTITLLPRGESYEK